MLFIFDFSDFVHFHEVIWKHPKNHVFLIPKMSTPITIKRDLKRGRVPLLPFVPNRYWVWADGNETTSLKFLFTPYTNCGTSRCGGMQHPEKLEVAHLNLSKLVYPSVCLSFFLVFNVQSSNFWNIFVEFGQMTCFDRQTNTIESSSDWKVNIYLFISFTFTITCISSATHFVL